MSLSASSGGAGLAPERRHVDAVLDRLDDRARRVGRVLDRVARAGAQRRVGHPADVGRRGRAPAPGGRRGRQMRSPRETSSSSARRTRDAHRREGLVERAVERVDRGDRRDAPGGQHDDLVAGAQRRRRRAARRSRGSRCSPSRMTYWTGKRSASSVAVGRDPDGLEVLEQRQAAVPRHRRGALDDVVAAQRAHRHEGDVAHGELAAERAERRARSRRSAPRRSRRGPSC